MYIHFIDEENVTERRNGRISKTEGIYMYIYTHI